MARVQLDTEFVPAVSIGAEAGLEAMVATYLPLIAFKLSLASGARTGHAYEMFDRESVGAVKPEDVRSDVFGGVGFVHIASAPGEPPAPLTGQLMTSAGVSRATAGEGAAALIGPNAQSEDGYFYGQALEHGEDGVLPRPAWGAVIGEDRDGDRMLESAFAEGFRGASI